MTLEEVLAQYFSSIGGRDVECERGAADLVGRLRQCFSGSGNVRGDDGGSVAGEDLGDGGTDTAGGSGDDGYLACERLVPRGRGLRVGVTDGDDLAVDECGLGREQEAEGGFEAGQAGRRLGGDVDELRGGSALDLFAELRVKPSRAR